MSKLIKKNLIVLLVALSIPLTGCNIQDFSYDKTKDTSQQQKSNNPSNANYDINGTVDSNNDVVPVKDDDKISLFKMYNLPNLERMSEEDQKKYLDGVQVLKKIKDLNISNNDFYTPEYNWKDIYNKSITNVYNNTNFSTIIDFNGTKASELNSIINENSNVQININSKEINLDETIKLKSNISLKGNETKLTGGDGIDKAIILDNVKNVAISGLDLIEKFNYGIYVIDSENVLVKGNNISAANYKALVLMGSNSYVNIINNYIYNNNNGAIFINGDSKYGVIQGNSVYNNKGEQNLTAGIVLSAMPIKDKYTAYNEFQDLYLYDLKDVPNNNIIKDNTIENGYSSGIYSDGGYMNYIMDNKIIRNDKEGICLDYGTFGTYVARNQIIENGGRKKQTDEDLKKDFIFEEGKLKDGSSPAKLPGLSIDNAAYNIIKDNYINYNYGSGVKMVRAGIRNIIMSNNISNNNYGQSDKFHFFGIELGYAQKPDEPVKGLDFISDYENIICRNTITGHHYSGIFLAEECYINDMFDNTIMDPNTFSIEALTDKQNNSVNNLSNKESRGISLSTSNPTISLPNTVK